MLTILIVILVLMMLGALPTWPHSRNWGYYPAAAWGSWCWSWSSCC